jgi:hypothetical protein
MLRVPRVMDMTTAGPASTDGPGRTFLQGLLDLRPTPSAERMGLTAETDAVARGLPVAKVYALVSSTVDVAGVRHTFLTRIQNGGVITGACIDALSQSHGLIGT